MIALITPIGRFQYKRTPQDFSSSGDGYNRRLDGIKADFNKRGCCVDDTLTLIMLMMEF
uniref:RETRotransposonlike family member (Retr1)like [Saccoglossus kowalevskii] n=1 Tax=Lepeophtheirus salmonis TaxID=72036 RepID=A0A0K2U6P2_LEPSM